MHSIPSGFPHPVSPLIALAMAILATAACSSAGTPAAAPEATASLATAGEADGQQAYDLACAGCHDTGAGGAPVTGDPAAWRERSSLWEAVLFEHAKSGYLQMPARGGMTELPDATVERAAEHMLSITHPDRPPDSG